MVQLPSNIPRYDEVPLIDLDAFEYLVAIRRKHWTLRAWTMLEETERRWTLFDWATFVVHQPRRCENLFRDFASAYLFSFEATLQVLKEELPALNTTWLSTQPAYDLVCRGLRTLRNTGAHVREVAIAPQPLRTVTSRFAHSTTGGTTAWAWPELASVDLTALTSKHMAVGELAEWNQRSGELLALGLMHHGVIALRDLLASVEPAQDDRL